MKTTTLGKSDLRVSRIAFGAWQLGGDWGHFDEEAAIAAIRHALDLGVNFFDTAHAYGSGASEHLLGKALRPELLRERDRLVIATKGGLRTTDSGLLPDARPAAVRSDVEASLAALGIDRIDLYQMHGADPDVPVAETAGALADLVAEGKIAHVGLSNCDIVEIQAFCSALPLATVQPSFEVFCGDIRSELLPHCRQGDIGVLVYASLALGVLTGMVNGDTCFATRDWWSHSTAYRTDGDRRNREIVSELDCFAAYLGLTISQLAIAWMLSQPGVHVAIVGARRFSQLPDSIAASEAVLTDADLAVIENIRSFATSV
jgi:aryl-alcohol dehydrogenase-like predicted oxidoreductase